MRIAVVFKDRCQPKRCNLECIAFCPPQRTGTEVIWIDQETGKAAISEETCIACSICVHKCPFDAIRIIGLPEPLKTDLIHQFGRNAFRLFRLPAPRKDGVTGILGPNGIGKTTALSILSGEYAPNLGLYRRKLPHWEDVLAYFKGTEMHDYFARLVDKKIRTALKPQYVDKLSKVYSGEVRALLAKVDQSGRMDEVVDALGMRASLDHDIRKLSGGELQKVAIAATMLKDADVYFFDEPSSYLDIHERLRVARVIRDLSGKKQVVVVEHDLAVLDFLADHVYLLYGSEGAYGVVAQPRPVRTAINVYLQGMLKEENIRFRDREITFEVRPPRSEWKAPEFLRFDRLEKRFDGFGLEVEGGILRKGEVVGVVGPNATGKTTFVKLLAGVEQPTSGEVHGEWQVSYKPQYLESAYEGTVRELLVSTVGKKAESGYFETEIAEPLRIRAMMERDVTSLSGGELQRVAIALCLVRDADIYLVDEPSAYLDSNQRMETARTIRRVMEKEGKTGLIVDHDVYFIDLVSDSIMVFGGEPGVRGLGRGPFDMRTGMNEFLRGVGITFRRDNETNRPRINKEDSRLDREQKSAGEHYYAVATQTQE
ncbi:MAG: ribosome biogenesis/translation initiation ATPase RLI [Euryarchaeota archaeon]|nr:ribosome biogenesis/translation initiation ATPase RLI [Euryarchaeota archaeon]